MTTDKQDLLDRFLQGRLSPEEVKEFNNALRADEELRNNLRFELAFKDAVHEELSSSLKRAFQAQKRRKRWIISGGFLLAIIIVLLFRPEKYFEDKEGRDRMEQFFNNDFRLQPRAGQSDQSWEELLLSSKDSPKYWKRAYKALLHEIENAKNTCDPGIPPQVYTYAGLLGLYDQRDYKISLGYLQCAYERDEVYREKLLEALIIAYLANDQREQAMDLYRRNRQLLSSSVLPAKSRQLLLNY